MKRTAAVVALALAGCGALAVAGWALAGPAGLLAVGVCATVLALAAIRWFPLEPRPRPPGPGAARTPFANADFARYRKIADALSWGQVSARMFDHAFRPVLERITAAILLDRGIDAATHPADARAYVGPALWELADPARPRSDDSHAPSPALDRVERLVDRLEDL